MKTRPPCKAAIALLALAAAWLSGAAPAWAAPEQYVLDPVHTRVLFAVEHAGFSSALGTVSGSTGTLLFDPEDWTSARLEVSVPLRQLDLGDDKWNRATLASNLLDAERHPDATFVTTGVEPIDPRRARVTGDLTVRGVTRPVTMEVVLNALKRHPLPPFRRTAGFSATATISRADFGITAWKSMIGDEVELRIEAEAVRGRPDGSQAGTTTPAETEDVQDAEDRPAEAPPEQEEPPLEEVP